MEERGEYVALSSCCGSGSGRRRETDKPGSAVAARSCFGGPERCPQRSINQSETREVERVSAAAKNATLSFVRVFLMVIEEFLSGE